MIEFPENITEPIYVAEIIDGHPSCYYKIEERDFYYLQGTVVYPLSRIIKFVETIKFFNSDIIQHIKIDSEEFYKNFNITVEELK